MRKKFVGYMKQHNEEYKVMKKRIISCLMLVIVIGFSYFYAHIDKNSYVYNRNADTGSFYGTGILEKNEDLTQTFIAEEDSIDGINIKVIISGNVENVVLHYALLDETLNTVCESSVYAVELKNNKFNQLELPEILGTKGKQYTLILNEENSDEQNGIGFYIEPDRQDNQQLSIKENETDGTLVTRIICHRFDLETFIVLLGMIAFVVVFMKILYKMFK